MQKRDTTMPGPAERIAAIRAWANDEIGVDVADMRGHVLWLCDWAVGSAPDPSAVAAVDPPRVRTTEEKGATRQSPPSGREQGDLREVRNETTRTTIRRALGGHGLIKSSVSTRRPPDVD